MKIYSNNEWDPLKSVVVGSAMGANWPGTDPIFGQSADIIEGSKMVKPSGPVPYWIQDETEEDLENLITLLQYAGVTVFRPTANNFAATQGLYNYCPRDRLIIDGDRIIDTTMYYPCRDQEINYLQEIIRDNTVMTMPRDQGLVLDAANIARLNDDWLFLRSKSGNDLAYQWLKQNVPHRRIHLCDFYAGVHIDSTIVPLREGLVLLNASRVNPTNLPMVLQSWDKIWVEDCVAQDFYQYPYASKWIGMNTLSLSPDTVIVDSAQTQLIHQIENHGMTVVPMTLRHSRTLGGGFHCVTLDLHRQS